MSDLGRIEQALTSMESSVDEDYATADVAFHLAVYAASHNSLLQRFGHLVADSLNLSFSVQQRAAIHDPADLDADAAAHRSVYRAINSGAAADANAAMLQLVLEGKAALASALERGLSTH